MESAFIPTSQLPTGDTAVGNPQRFSFVAPSDLWIIQSLMGLISDYSTPGSWYQVGTATPEDAAAIFSRLFSTFGVDMATTGAIIPFGGGILPSGWLPCDGASYLRSDFPALFAAIGTVWGAADSTHFNVPDLRGKTLVGQGTNPGTGTTFALGASGGEEAHTQTLSELATHSHVDAGHTHIESGAGPNLTTIGPGAPEPTAVPVPAVTGVGNASIQNAGSSTPANVMQPYGVVNYAIIS
jgi:microcystin-dependent protein